MKKILTFLTFVLLLLPSVQASEAENQAFERFFKKAQSLSGSRKLKGGSRLGGFKYTAGPLRGKTEGQGREWCLKQWKTLSPSVKKKYYNESKITGNSNKKTSKGAPVTLHVGDSFSINGTRGTIGQLEVIDNEALSITVRTGSTTTAASSETYTISIK
jgi:hypothetical protein